MSADVFDQVCESLARRKQIIVAAGLDKLPDGSVSQEYRFEHALYQDVFVNRQTPGRRAKLHRLIGERLEDIFQTRVNEAAARIAYHFEEAAEWSRAVKYLGIAAETTCRRHAPREATTILRHALNLCARLPGSERAVSETEILEKLAPMYVVSVDMRALGAYRTLRKRAAHHGLVEIEVRALIDIAYPLS